MTRFKHGDVVRRKSGGPKWTVYAISGTDLGLVRFDDQAKLRKKAVPLPASGWVVVPKEGT